MTGRQTDAWEDWPEDTGNIAGPSFSVVMTASLCGFETELVLVETDLSQGLPALYLVGLPNLTVKESKERIRSAIINSGHRFPNRRITVNLSPADTKKEGSHFDLPMAVGVLAASLGLDDSVLRGRAFLGELSLDGRVCRSGIGLPLILGLRESGIREVFLPEGNINEAMAVDGLALYPVTHLNQVVGHLNGESPMIPVLTSSDGAAMYMSGEPDTEIDDFSEVKGQEAAKRAFQICAAGGHDMSMCGPPGVGKSMLAERLPGILPPLSQQEMLEVTKIYNIAGRNPWEGKLVSRRPFRAPHHSIPPASLLGGGARPTPGELSLAHLGALFLDELPEFERRTLDMLRQPLEDGFIDLSRVGNHCRYPCDFILVTARNPCPCGYYGDPFHTCTCKSWQRQRYRDRVSGPLLDRIDIHITVNRVMYKDFKDDTSCLSSGRIREGVIAAREMQEHRYRDENVKVNSRLNAAFTDKYCSLDREGDALMKSAFKAFGLSARQGKKMVRLARTIADIEGAEKISEEHLAEAIGYRRAEPDEGLAAYSRGGAGEDD